MKTILVIEDERQTRENLSLILQMEGFHVLTASNGSEGLSLANDAQPDLILCDVSMPEMDGHAVLRALRLDPKLASLPFIFLTARGERQEQRAGMNLGADDYMVKPIEPDDLLAAIQARLDRQRQASDAVLRELDAELDFSTPVPLEGLGLTPREAEVLLWVAQGKSNADTATILGLSDKTVKIHLAHIYEKLGVETRTAAAMHALETLSRSRSSRSAT